MGISKKQQATKPLHLISKKQSASLNFLRTIICISSQVLGQIRPAPIVSEWMDRVWSEQENKTKWFQGLQVHVKLVCVF